MVWQAKRDADGRAIGLPQRDHLAWTSCDCPGRVLGRLSLLAWSKRGRLPDGNHLDIPLQTDSGGRHHPSGTGNGCHRSILGHHHIDVDDPGPDLCPCSYFCPGDDVCRRGRRILGHNLYHNLCASHSFHRLSEDWHLSHGGAVGVLRGLVVNQKENDGNMMDLVNAADSCWIPDVYYRDIWKRKQSLEQAPSGHPEGVVLVVHCHEGVSCLALDSSEIRLWRASLG